MECSFCYSKAKFFYKRLSDNYIFCVCITDKYNFFKHSDCSFYEEIEQDKALEIINMNEALE